MGEESRRRFAAMMFGLDIRYDLGEGHPLLGRRMPDLDLVTADGPLRFSELLHAPRPVLLNLGEPGGFDIRPWADRVQLIDASYAGRVGASGARRGRRPLLPCWSGPTGMWPGSEIRPIPGLAEALTSWFGPRHVGSASAR